MALAGFLSLAGQETMVLNNGSCLYGHKSREDFTAKTVQFAVDSALVTESLDNIYYTAPVLQRLDNMKDNWANWFRNNPDMVVNNNGRPSGRLGKIEYRHDNKDNEFEGSAVIVELSDSTVTFFTINQVSVKYKTEEIDHYEYETRDPLALVGVIDEIVKTDGSTLSGQIVAEYKDRTILLADDGVRHVVQRDDIRAIRMLPYNTNMPLADQLPYYKRIEYRNGSDKSTVNGIITERVRKPANGEGAYYEILSPDGTTPRKYPAKDVLTFSLVPNNRYVNERDVVIDDDEILVDRIPLEKVRTRITTDGYDILDGANCVTVSMADLNEDNLKVYYKDVPRNAELYLVEARPVMTDGDDDGKKKKKRDDDQDEPAQYRVSFSEVLLNSLTPSDRFVSPASNVSVNYGPVRAGKYYMLMRKSDKSAYLIYVKH